MTGAACCQCNVTVFQLGALLHFHLCSQKQHPKVAKVQDIHEYIWVCSWSLPLVREPLVKGLGTIFCSHTCQRPFSIQASMSPHARHTEKRRRHGAHRRERKRTGSAACICWRTCVHQLMLRKKTNPVPTFEELNVNVSHSNHQEGKKNTRMMMPKTTTCSRLRNG